MYTLLIIIHLLICVLLTLVILLQSSKGGGLAGTFGGATMGAMFGGKGTATFLRKVTSILATAFMVLSLLLGLLTRGSVNQESVVQRNLDRFRQSQARELPQQVGEEAVDLPPAVTQPATPATESPDDSRE